MAETHITILGDIIPTEKNIGFFKKGDADGIFTDVLQYLKSSDIVICNLECPLTDSKEKALKSGAHFSASQDCVNGLKAAGVTIAGLANNHMRDYKDQGVIDTIDTCKRAGIIPLGVGRTVEEAKQPVYIELDKFIVGILAICDNESICTDDSRWGCYGYDELETMDWIEKCKLQCDYLVVLYHAGIEHYQYPSPFLQRRCRKMIAKGADLVTCQHSHCIGAQESYLHGDILYGQGNSVFFKQGKNELWNTGLLIRLELKNNAIKAEYIPTVMKNGSISLADGQLRKRICDSFSERSVEILSEEVVKRKWKEFSKEMTYRYYDILRGYGKYLSKINKTLKNRIARFFIDDQSAIRIATVVRSESHREALLEVIGNDINYNE